MCEICRKTPCDSRCPNAEQPMTIECTECGGDIYLNEEYWDFGNEFGITMCEDCKDRALQFSDDVEEDLICSCCEEYATTEDPEYFLIPNGDDDIVVCAFCMDEHRETFEGEEF